MKALFASILAIIVVALSIKLISIGASFYQQESEERGMRIQLEDKEALRNMNRA